MVGDGIFVEQNLNRIKNGYSYITDKRIDLKDINEDASHLLSGGSIYL